MWRNFLPILFLGVFCLIGLDAYSIEAPNGGGGPQCWPPPCSVPIDGGISMLLAAGAAYGGLKIAKRKK